MEKAPKVLTRMRLSCCWGDNLNEKELNEVVDYINDLEQQCKTQKETIDKVRNNLEKDISVIKNVKMSNKEIICRLEETNKMLKEVSE